MPYPRLEQLLESAENSDIEFKSGSVLKTPTGENRYKIAKQLVGFGNRNGGKLIFGIDDDTKDLEGMSLDEEKSLATISQISRMNCSPPVMFEFEYLSEYNYNSEEGDLVVVDLFENDSPPPHAITSNQDGEIRKREYRIRAGDETRLVTDNELTAMFSENVETHLNSAFTSITIFSLDDNDIWRPKQEIDIRNFAHSEDYDFTPHSFGFSRLLNYYREENNEKLNALFGRSADDTIVLIELASDLNLLYLFIMLHNSVPDGELDQNEVEYVDIRSILSDLSFPVMGELNIESIVKKEEEEATSYPRFDDNEVKGIPVPRGTEISVSDDILSSEIQLETSRGTEITISYVCYNGQRGLPGGHPLSGEISRRYEFPDIWSVTAEFGMEAEFAYPKQSYSSYKFEREYFNDITGMIENRYNWEKFLKGQPDPYVLTLEGYLQDIQKKLDNMIGPND